MFEKPQKAQVVRIKIEAVSLDSTSMAPSLDGPLLAELGLIIDGPSTIRSRRSAFSRADARNSPARG